MHADTATTLSYDWDDICSALGIESTNDLSAFILNPSFLEAWVAFRDHLPLKPNDPDSESSLKLPNGYSIDAFVRFLLEMVSDSWLGDHSSALLDRGAWGPVTHTKRLFYQATRDLAKAGQPFHRYFQHWSDRKEAKVRILGLFKLALNLCKDYASVCPSHYTRAIESVKPALNPEWSPLPEVRKRWQLERTSVTALMEKVREEQQKTGMDEKEWLVKRLLEIEEMTAGKDKRIEEEAAIDEGSGESNETVGVGTKRPAVLNEQVENKKKKTE